MSGSGIYNIHTTNILITESSVEKIPPHYNSFFLIIKLQKFKKNSKLFTNSFLSDFIASDGLFFVTANKVNYLFK